MRENFTSNHSRIWVNVHERMTPSFHKNLGFIDFYINQEALSLPKLIESMIIDIFELSLRQATRKYKCHLDRKSITILTYVRNYIIIVRLLIFDNEI